MTPYAATLQNMLQTEVRVQAPAEAIVRQFEHYESDCVNVVRTSGDPMRVANAASDATAIFVYRMLRGRCRMTHDDGDVPVESGEFVVFHGARALAVVHEAPYEMIGVRLSESLVRRWLPEWEMAEFLPVGNRCAEGEMLFGMAADLLKSGARLEARSAPIVADAMTRLLAHSLTGTLGQAQAPATCRLEWHRRRVRQFCRRHMASPDLDIASIGRGVGLSATHLHRLFESEPLTLMAWIRAERLDASYAAIQSGPEDLHLLRLACSLGFKDPAHFSHAFRRRFGMSPRQLRARRSETGRLV